MSRHHSQHRRFTWLLACSLTASSVVFTAATADPPQAPQDQLRLRAISTPPTFLKNEGYDQVWADRVRQGIDAARKYLGNYGPTHVYVLGQLDDELEGEGRGEAFIETMCQRRHPNNQRGQLQCLARGEVEQLEKARNSETTEAYLSGIAHVETPFAELFFINPHNFGNGEAQSRAIHEYTHVRQMALPVIPNWMMEGSADVLAWHLGELNGGSNLQKFMGYALDRLKTVQGEYSIEDFEPQVPTKAGAEKYIRHYAYDAGAWAVVFIIHSSPTRSIRDYHDRFYPRVSEVGWKKSLNEYGGFESTEKFYEQFEEFLDRSRAEKMKVLSEIRP